MGGYALYRRRWRLRDQHQRPAGGCQANQTHTDDTPPKHQAACPIRKLRCHSRSIRVACLPPDRHGFLSVTDGSRTSSMGHYWLLCSPQTGLSIVWTGRSVYLAAGTMGMMQESPSFVDGYITHYASCVPSFLNHSSHPSIHSIHQPFDEPSSPSHFLFPCFFSHCLS
jgi:hypothetical protein